MTRRALPVGGAALLAASLACNGGDAPVSAPQSETASEALAAEDGLQLESWDAFEMPVPVGARLDERGGEHAHYSIAASATDVLAFFGRHIPDFVKTDYDAGVKLEAVDLSERALYVYAEEGEEDTLITYYDPSPGERREDAVAQLPGPPMSRSVARDGASVVVTYNRQPSRTAMPVGHPGHDARGGSAADTDEPPPFLGTRGRAVVEAVGSDGRGGHGVNPNAAGAPNAGGVPQSNVNPSAGQPSSSERQPNHRGTTNPGAERPLDFVHGEFERPRNPNAYY